MQGKKEEKECGSQRGLEWREEWGKSRLCFRPPFSFEVLARKKKERNKKGNNIMGEGRRGVKGEKRQRRHASLGWLRIFIL